MFAKAVEDLAKVLAMFVVGVGEDQQVVEIDHKEAVNKVPKNGVHESLESGGGVTEPHRHDQVLKRPVLGRKCRLLNVLQTDSNLVEPSFKVNLGEVLRFSKLIVEFVWARKRSTVLLRDVVGGAY